MSPQVSLEHLSIDVTRYHNIVLASTLLHNVPLKYTFIKFHKNKIEVNTNLLPETEQRFWVNTSNKIMITRKSSINESTVD